MQMSFIKWKSLPASVLCCYGYLIWIIYALSRYEKERKNMQSHTRTSLNLSFLLLQTGPCAVERLYRPLSLRLKPKGNDIPIGNIRNGTQLYICWPAGLSTRHSPGRWDGEIKRWIGSTPPGREYKHQIPQRPS